MSFRFQILEGEEETFTQWYDESLPLSAPTIANQLRAANPEASLNIQRRNGRAEDLNRENDGG